MNGRGKDWFIRTATDADLGRPDRRLGVVGNVIDIFRYGGTEMECCGRMAEECVCDVDQDEWRDQESFDD